MTDAPPSDLLTWRFSRRMIGKEFSILHPQVPAEFKLRLTTAYDPSKGASHPKFRKPLTLTFRGPAEPLLLEGVYDIQTEGFGPASLLHHPDADAGPGRERHGLPRRRQLTRDKATPPPEGAAALPAWITDGSDRCR